MPPPPSAYVLKHRLSDPLPHELTLDACKTMYGGKGVRPGDIVFLFADEAAGGRGLVARGVVVAVRPVAGIAGRATPRVDLVIGIAMQARGRLGRRDLRPHDTWSDGRPETELNFKFFRQATNKLGGISAEAAAFLAGYFDAAQRAPD